MDFEDENGSIYFFCDSIFFAKAASGIKKKNLKWFPLMSLGNNAHLEFIPIKKIPLITNEMKSMAALFNFTNTDCKEALKQEEKTSKNYKTIFQNWSKNTKK